MFQANYFVGPRLVGRHETNNANIPTNGFRITSHPLVIHFVLLRLGRKLRQREYLSVSSKPRIQPRPLRPKIYRTATSCSKNIHLSVPPFGGQGRRRSAKQLLIERGEKHAPPPQNLPEQILGDLRWPRRVYSYRCAKVIDLDVLNLGQSSVYRLHVRQFGHDRIRALYTDCMLASSATI